MDHRLYPNLCAPLRQMLERGLRDYAKRRANPAGPDGPDEPAQAGGGEGHAPRLDLYERLTSRLVVSVTAPAYDLFYRQPGDLDALRPGEVLDARPVEVRGFRRRDQG